MTQENATNPPPPTATTTSTTTPAASPNSDADTFTEDLRMRTAQILYSFSKFFEKHLRIWRRIQRILGYEMCTEIRKRQGGNFRPYIDANYSGPFVIEMKKSWFAAAREMAKSPFGDPLLIDELLDY